MPSRTTQPEVIVSSNAYRDAAEYFVSVANASIQRSGRFSVALSGSSTPKHLFELLVSPEWRDRVQWEKGEYFWGDERFVPHNSPMSNYRMAYESLLSKLPIPQQRVHPVPTENIEPSAAAAKYEREIVQVLGGPLPSFDLNLLGVGTNGHTASLFPHRPTLHETKRLVVSDDIPEASDTATTRITFTLPLINASRHVLFLAVGAQKADIVAEVIAGNYRPENLPSQLVQPDPGTLTWILDEAAGAKLPQAITHAEKRSAS